MREFAPMIALLDCTNMPNIGAWSPEARR